MKPVHGSGERASLLDCVWLATAFQPTDVRASFQKRRPRTSCGHGTTAATSAVDRGA